MIVGAVLLSSLLALAGPGEKGDIVWMKLDQARVAAARAQKPIFVMVMVDPKNGSSVCSKSCGLDRALEDAAVARRSGDFCFVRLTDRKAAAELRATRCLEAIFLDPDGEEVHRAEFKDAAALDRSMATAVERCSARPVPWASTDGSLPAAAGGRPVVLVFADDRKESVDGLKALEDRAVASLHEKFVFVKVPWKKDGEEAKRWGAALAPSVVVVDPSSREVLDRAAGRKAPRDLRALLLKALAKAEKK
jgi:hypothetical protein